MKVCIIGNSLISLTLAKNLVKQGVGVDIFSSKKYAKYKKSKTLGISKSNINFFNNNIENIEKLLWNINKIEIYSENFGKEKILSFENHKKRLFSIIKNYELYDLLFKKLKKNKLCNFKKMITLNNLLTLNYKLIINTDYSHPITKKFFSRQIKKDYKSHAYISIIFHKKLENNLATQIFTSNGPLAFLPLSETQTSIVYSYNGKEKLDFKKYIEKYNEKYEILSFSDVSTFNLKSINLRSYFHKNILAFGDILHKIHPLAGQGFNMALRDVKEISHLIESRKKNGLDLDKTICLEFEKITKHKNYIFSNGIDFVYEYFNFESKIKNNILSKSVKFLGKNNTINKLFKKYADYGLII